MIASASQRNERAFGDRSQSEQRSIRGFTRRVSVFLCSGFVALTNLLQGASAPEIASIQPAALQPGLTNVVTLRGKNLAGASLLWTSWSGIVSREDGSAWSESEDTLRIPLVIRGDHPPGQEMLRLAGTNGVSNPALLLVDRLLTTNVAASGVLPEEGPLLVPPVSVDGVCRDSILQFYRLHLRADERVTVEVVANRLGCDTDPVVRILDESGREVGYANDTPGLGTDCALEFEATTAGFYAVEVHDSDFSTGTAYRYRLRVGRFPVGVMAVVPETARYGPVSGRWESMQGWREGAGRVVLPSFATGTTARLKLSGRRRADALTPRLAITDRAVAFEFEPNDVRETATSVDASHLIAGRFDAPRDRDWYRLAVDAPGRWRIGVRSRELGLPCDPILRLTDESGKRIALSPQDTLDPSIWHRFEEKGVYYISVEEAGRRFGAGRNYVLDLVPHAPGFEISSETERLQVPVHGRVETKIKIARHGYNGPIRFEASRLPMGFTLDHDLTEPGKSEWTLVIASSDAMQPGMAGEAVITARAVDEDRSGSVQLDLRPALRKEFPKVLSLPPGFGTTLWLCTVQTEEQQTASATQ